MFVGRVARVVVRVAVREVLMLVRVAVDPDRFVRNNLPRLLQFCERKFSTFRFFASSVVGSSATLVDPYGCRTQIPFHIEPRGITEPLEWIIGPG